jgi:hypothetical protein
VVRALLVLVAGCAIDDRMSIEVPVQSGGVDLGPFVDEAGVTTVDEASVTFSDLRLEEPPATGLTARLGTALGGTAAYAHPGHDYPGDVAGELLGTFTVDLLGAPDELGPAVCYDGRYATARVSVAGAFATFGGTYSPQGGAPVPFHFVVSADQDILDLPFEVTLDAAAPPDAILVTFDVGRVFSYVDWSEGDTDADGVLTDADGSFGNTIRFGAVASPTWAVALR